MSAKTVKTRRQRNQELASIDAANRCGVCKIALPVKVFLNWGDPKMYCSEECRKQAAGGR